MSCIVTDGLLCPIAYKFVGLTDDAPRQAFDFAGLDMKVIVERYPAGTPELSLSLDELVPAGEGNLTPYFVKATQVDGHMAWASPIIW